MKVATLFVPILLAASLTTASFATAQQSPPPPHGERGMHDHGPDGPGGDDDHGPGPGMHPHGVMLTEAQQDKLFALHHAAEPAQRERHKTMRHAHDALREMADSGHFDEAKAAALAQTLGQAMAAEELDHAREQAQFLALLTPEQRAKLQQRGDQRMGKDGGKDGGKDAGKDGAPHGPGSRP